MNFTIENVVVKGELGGNDRMTFISTNGDELQLDLYGDCCSSSYFDLDSKLDALSLLGERLASIEYNEVAGTPTENVDQTLNYALIIRTDKQSITLMWRNDSNGYYSGSVHVQLNGVDMTCTWLNDKVLS